MSSHQQNIRGRDYAFGIIPPIEAIEVEVAICRVIGEPLFKSLMQVGKDENGKVSKEEFMAIAGSAIGLMSSRMDAKELIATMDKVFKYVSCDGKRIEMNSTFVGRNRELWEVFFVGLRHNFSDFLPDSLSGSLPDILKG